MTAALLCNDIQQFMSGLPSGVVVEDGDVAFNLADSKYSLSSENDRCVLHLWSSERNSVRRVIDLERKSGNLHLTVARLGRPRPSLLKICRCIDPKQPKDRELRRKAHDRLLGRVLLKTFPNFRIVKLKSSMDLEHSFGPAYARGVLRSGSKTFAVVGVNAGEPQATVNGALTVGLLWLHYLRESSAGQYWVSGLKLVVPSGCSDVVRARIKHLDRSAAQLELYEMDEYSECLEPIDTSIDFPCERIVHCPNRTSAFERFAPHITKVREIVPECEVSVISPAKISFRVLGLEFAQANLAGSIHSTNDIVFGQERVVLSPDTEPLLRAFAMQLQKTRRSAKERLWRSHPERWLQSLVAKHLRIINPKFDLDRVYERVPECRVSGRQVGDLLTRSDAGRLAVLAISGDEDMHFALQALDYWSHVTRHHDRSEFSEFGYFRPEEVDQGRPELHLIAPAFRIHPASETLLRYFSPAISWTLVAVNENWRKGLRVVFRKRREDIAAAQNR